VKLRHYLFNAAFGLFFAVMACAAFAAAAVQGSIGHFGLALMWAFTSCGATCMTAEVIATHRKWRRDDREFDRQIAHIGALINADEFDDAELELWKLKRSISHPGA
jgi:hypothetical protein